LKKTINIRGTLLDLSVPQVMGIINITPDSFLQTPAAATRKPPAKFCRSWRTSIFSNTVRRSASANSSSRKRGREGERKKGRKFFVDNLECIYSKFKTINKNPISISPLPPFTLSSLHPFSFKAR